MKDMTIESAEEFAKRIVGALRADFTWDPCGSTVRNIQERDRAMFRAGALAALGDVREFACADSMREQLDELERDIEAGKFGPKEGT